jgi:hypothetical protein
MDGLIVSNEMLHAWFSENVDDNNDRIELDGLTFKPSAILRLNKHAYDMCFNLWLSNELCNKSLLQDDNGNIYEPF